MPRSKAEAMLVDYRNILARNMFQFPSDMGSALYQLPLLVSHAIRRSPYSCPIQSVGWAPAPPEETHPARIDQIPPE